MFNKKRGYLRKHGAMAATLPIPKCVYTLFNYFPYQLNSVIFIEDFFLIIIIQL